MDAKQLACAHSSLILANNFAPVSEALYAKDGMQTFKLSPIIGWNKFIDNSEVAKYIYAELVPLANAGVLKYDNFISELGNFSSDDGFCSMEFLLNEDDVEMEILVDLFIGINTNQENNTFKLLTENLRSKFGLVECL